MQKYLDFNLFLPFRLLPELPINGNQPGARDPTDVVHMCEPPGTKGRVEEGGEWIWGGGVKQEVIRHMQRGLSLNGPVHGKDIAQGWLVDVSIYSVDTFTSISFGLPLGLMGCSWLMAECLTGSSWEITAHFQGVTLQINVFIWD